MLSAPTVIDDAVAKSRNIEIAQPDAGNVVEAIVTILNWASQEPTVEKQHIAMLHKLATLAGQPK